MSTLNSVPSLGPAVTSSVVSRNFRSTVDAWCDYLHHHIHTESVLTKAVAESLKVPWLEGHRVAWLANELNEPWLRIIEIPTAKPREVFKNYGWLSLEISVEDVDQLYKELVDSPFTIIGKPANLDVSDDIRAMQVVGPSGEVLYLTQLKAKVPPFEIPFARCAVDKLFIPVAMVPDRDQARDFYNALGGTKSYDFDTKITVINNALGIDKTSRHPVSVIQLTGQNMIELDEINQLEPAPTADSNPVSGIISVSFEVPKLPGEPSSFITPQGPYIGHPACYIFGAAGELIELIEVSK